jgi:hypothetical protein
VGNYSLYLEIFDSNTSAELQQTNGTALINEYNFTLQNMSARIPDPAEQGTMRTDHQDEYVSQVAQFAYSVFAALSKWIG